MSSVPDHDPECNLSCPASDLPIAARPEHAADGIDLREALFNSGAVGRIQEVQVSTERIVQLRGVLFDLDPHLIKVGPVTPVVPQVPDEFYAALVRPWLDRHPVLRRAEVRNSGTGVHAILRFAEPVVFEGDADRNRWIGIVKVVQCALPIDSNQPGITAVTRPLASVNGKNSATVTLLNVGEPVPVADVIQLFDEMVASPFKNVMKILAGAERLEPCPVCRKQDTSLAAMDFVGRCYSCGNVQLEELYALVIAPPESKEADSGTTSKNQ